MMSATFSNTRSHDAFMQGQSRLTELALAGQLTRELLGEAMKAMYDDGDYIDMSIGFAWLTSKPDLFSQTAIRCGFAVGAFLLEHGALCWVGSRMLLYPDVLKLIPDSEREEFVKTVYRRHGAFNNSWIANVIELGVPLTTVTSLIFEKLEAVSDDCEKSNVVNAVWEFLDDHGSTHRGDIHWSLLTDEKFSQVIARLADSEPARFLAHRGCIEGRLGTARYSELAVLAEPRRHEPPPHFPLSWEPTHWAVLSDAQFDTAITIAVRKAPRKAFEKRGCIEERLGKARFAELGRESVLKLDRLSKEQQSFVQEQPIDFQVTVAHNLKAGAKGLVPLLVKLDAHQGARLYQEMSAIFGSENIADIYRSTWALRHQDGQPLAPWLEVELKRRLTESGCFIGTVTEGTFTPRDGRPQRQLQVLHNGRTYVKERRQSGYYPKVGDQVIINPNGGYNLTPWVTAVMFLPACSAQEVRAY